MPPHYHLITISFRHSYDRYLEHVRRLEEEVIAAKGHADAAAKELSATHHAAAQAERELVGLQQACGVNVLCAFKV